MNEFLEKTYYNNPVQSYLIALGIILAGFIVANVVKNIILIRLKKLSERTETHFDNYILNSIERFGIPALYILATYAGLRYLRFTETINHVLSIALTVAITFLVIRLISSTILSLLEAYIRKQHKESGEEKVKQLSGIMLIINIVIWVLGLIFLFDNMGYNVSALIAGLGVGGIAIALAAQNILGDLFNYFVIFFDKPFETGDFIIIDDKLGVVEHIGLKTTRLNSLWGEQLIFSNSYLTNSPIKNYKEMQKRRVVFTIRIAHETPLELVKKIPGILKSIVEAQDNITFDRGHFASFGDFSLDFEVVYYVLSGDYNMYMDIQQQINFKIYEILEEMGVAIASPTRRLWFSNALMPEKNEAYSK